MYKSITEVWSDLDAGKTIYWSNTSYKLYISDAYPDNEYQKNHFTNRDGKIISARCISNYFGSLLNENDLTKLFKE